MNQPVSRRSALLGAASAVAGAMLVGQRPASAQSIVAPLEGAPTLVMFHVEAGW